MFFYSIAGIKMLPISFRVSKCHVLHSMDWLLISYYCSIINIYT